MFMGFTRSRLKIIRIDTNATSHWRFPEKLSVLMLFFNCFDLKKIYSTTIASVRKEVYFTSYAYFGSKFVQKKVLKWYKHIKNAKNAKEYFYHVYKLQKLSMLEYVLQLFVHKETKVL